MMNGYSESSIPKSSKKRKNRMLDAEDGGSASDKKKKSRKHARADEVTDFDPKGKGKARAAVQEYSEEEEEASEFVVVTASVRLSVPPIFSTNPRAGVEEMLDSMIMKHVPSLHGVVLAHHNIQFLDDTALIQNECPFMICNIAFEATVWSPRIGMKLFAKVNLFSPDHISLLIHRTFNISIPRNHIPEFEFEFDDQASRFPGHGADVDIANSMDVDDGSSSKPQIVGTLPKGLFGTENSAEIAESMGRWVRRSTGEKVGGDDGLVEFTVIGMTLANQMISLIGSLQGDPFNPAHSLKSSVDQPLRPRRSHSMPPNGNLDDEPDIEDISLPAVEDLVVGDDQAANEARRLRKEEKRMKKAAKKAAKLAMSEANGERDDEQPPRTKKKHKAAQAAQGGSMM